MENPVLADTDVLIDYFNGISPIAEIVESLIGDDRLIIAAISVFELYAGIIGKKRIKAIDLLLKCATILPLEEHAAKKAAQFYTDLKTIGKLIGNQDLLIAAIAICNNLPLLTRNKDHFDRVKEVNYYDPNSIKTS